MSAVDSSSPSRQPARGDYDVGRIVQALAATGGAAVALSAAHQEALASLRQAAARFFRQDSPTKQRHADRGFTFGFRPFGRQYSVAPDRPDLNESFTYWADEPANIPHSAEIGWFTAALHAYWQVVEGLATEVIDEVARTFGAPPLAPIRPTSYIEVNWYTPREPRDLLQDRHEDGHLITIAVSDASGLETEAAGAMRPAQLAPGEVLVMAGSLLTDMTGGWISPLFHQVRNHGHAERTTALFLVNPDYSGPVTPFVANEHNRGVDIAARARRNGQMFGLPDAPLARSGAGQ